MCRRDGHCFDKLANTSSTRRGTRPGRKLFRHIQCVRLTAASYNNPGVNTRNLIPLTVNEPEKSLFNVNSFCNTLSSDFKSKYIKVIVRSCRRHARVLLSIINFRNLYAIDYLHDDQKVEVPLTVHCPNVQSLRNKAIYVANYVVS